MRAELRLFQAWREHRLINAINHVVFQVDDAGRLIFLNAAWMQLSGYAVGESLGERFCDYLHAEDVAAGEQLLQNAREGICEPAVLRLQTRRGATTWVRVQLRAAPSEGASSQSLIGSLSDVSAERNAAAQYEARIQDLLAHRAQQVSFSARVAREFASGKPPGELYEWCVGALNEAFGYAYTQLFRYDSTRETPVLIAASGKMMQDVASSRVALNAAGGALGEALATGQVVLKRAGEQNSKWQAPAMLQEEVGSALAAPIVLGEAVLGAVVVYGSSADSLGEEDRLLLQGLAGLLATAMESMSLRQEMEERLEELDNLKRLMRREAWLRARESYASGVRGYRFDRRLMEAVEASRNEDALWRGEQTGQDGSKRPALARPLQIRGETFGVLGVEDDPQAPLTTDDVQLLEAISQQVAEAMENARLLEQTQKRAVELETVARVSTATSTILEKDKLLQGVVELTKRSFNLYHAHIYLLDVESGELLLAAGSGEAGQQMVRQGWRIALDEPRSVVALTARARKGIIVNDVRSETGFLPNPLLPATRSELAVPMISGNRLLGVLDVQADSVNYFTQDDVRIQSALAGQVATALQNATLYQEQLETAEKLREFDRLKSEFLASMSHELRTPLNSVIGFADVLLEGIDGELNERMREDVQLIRNSGQHLRELIGDILDMSKIEAGMMDLRYEKIDIAELRQEIEGFARTQLMAHDKELAFHMRVGPDVSFVEADRTRFKQVLFNLVSNAIKFTAKGSVTLAMGVEEDRLLVRVTDTGIGIKEENIPLIFEQFRQVDGSLTRTAGGTGLGLPISKSLVELHGGEIWVESETGAGTSFFFALPLERSPRRRGEAQEVIAKSNGRS